MTPHILLIDLPTFPKGTVSLSLPYLASILSDSYRIKIFDLNFDTENTAIEFALSNQPVMVGIKVSSQNHHIAQKISILLKTTCPSTKIIWGGEYPTLLSDQCLHYTNTIVKGLFDSVAEEFLKDLRAGTLQQVYEGGNKTLPEKWSAPNWDLIGNLKRYNQFMGLPLETTRGCTESCTFCMVLIMQRKHYHKRPLTAIANEVAAIGHNFINIIDYNFGVDREHVVGVCTIIKQSKALGFMAEMTIELLDDDEVLKALSAARCKMVYCGLETIDEIALKSVGKDRTNHIENYRRIIRKAQKAGVNVASGFILGMEHSTFDSYRNTVAFFKEMGVIYAKFTFLTFNPGTRSQMFYRKKGHFITEDPKHYDGNHLTFLPKGVSAEDTYNGTRWFIGNFYSLRSIINRSMSLPMPLHHRLSFVLFNLCYREVYLTWLKEDTLKENWNSDVLLERIYQKGWKLKFAESSLIQLWKMQCKLF